MKTYSFSLVLADVEVMTEEIAEKLFLAGCDDASPFSSEGVARVDFDREAQSFSAALLSAIYQVRSCDLAVSEFAFDEGFSWTYDSDISFGQAERALHLPLEELQNVVRSLSHISS